jgi:thiosulfate reductase cytochrome b subunit
MNKEIKFKDLSTSLKVLVVFGWIYTSIFIMFFLIGLIGGLLSI